MSWFLFLMALGLLADAARLRRRIASTPRLAPSDQAASPDHVFIVAPGVELDLASRRAASAHAREHHLEVLDLIPGDASVATRLGLAQMLDPASYRGQRFVLGRSAGYAMLATADVLARAGQPPEPRDPVAFARLAATLKRYACTSTSFAVAPGLHARGRDPNARRAVVMQQLGEFYMWALLAPLLVAGLFAYGLVVAPLAAAIALAVYQLEPLLVCIGVARPRDLALVTIARLPLELWRSMSLLADRWRPEDRTVAEARPIYQQLLEGGWQKFFDPPVTACVHCGATELKTMFSTGDHFQQKPGRFTLVRCRDCGVVFQNPRLNALGLAFYYRDYYDGLGADITEYAFSNYGPVYRDRARMMMELTNPRRWLDVGCGHGHFCCATRDTLPGTEMHGLDWGASVEDAKRRGWIDHAHRGSLPEVAATLGRSYDVVSMFHYMEHVLEPAREIAAAREVLEPGGYLIIEVPEPDSLIGRALGRLWVNWLQPQHLRFLSIRHLDALLRAQGFTPVKWHRQEAHMPIDLSWAVILLLQRLGPLTDQPWNPPSSSAARFRRQLVWTLGAPVVIIAGLLDRILGAFANPLRSWNLYRVVARLDPPPPEASASGQARAWGLAMVPGPQQPPATPSGRPGRSGRRRRTRHPVRRRSPR